MGAGSRQLFTDQFLAAEIERTIYEFTWAYEGERETTTDTGDAVIHELAVPWFDYAGFIGRLTFDEPGADARLDALIERVTAEQRQFLWVTGDSTRPADLPARLLTRGLKHTVTWNGMALRDLSQPIEHDQEIVVEQLSARNAAAYAALCAELSPDPIVRDERLAAAHRLLAAGQRDAQAFIAFLDGKAISCAVLRVEPTGVAYLRNATTHPDYRGRGAYLALIHARLAFARQAGCGAAVVQAQVQSSSPILKKRGFETLCHLKGLQSGPGETHI